MRRALTRTLIALSLFLAAAAIGYWLVSSLGQEVVREEIEGQLSRLMEGAVTVERARVVVHWGLRLEAEEVEVYPGPSGPGLSAEHIDAEVDVFSLLLGRFRLRTLEVDALRMQIERDAAGRWSPYPLAVLQQHRRPDEDLESHLAPILAFESVARALLSKPLVADLVTVRNARVQLVDWLPNGADGPPLRLSLQSAQGQWDHRWFSSANELSLRGVLEGEGDRRAAVEAEGQRLGSGHLRWTVAVTALPLETLRPYARLIRARELGGRLSGTVAFETTGAESDAVELDWVLSGLAADVPWRDASAHLSGERVALKARLELRPKRVGLTDVSLSTGGRTAVASGFIERPLRDASRTRLSVEVAGMDLDGLRGIAAALPPVDRKAFGRILEPFEGGRLARVHGAARGRLSTWRELLDRGRLTLPPGFLLGAEVEDAILRLGDEPDDAIHDLDSVIEWTGDRLQTRDMTGVWKGERLPRLALSIQGVSNLFASPRSEREVRPGAVPVPGLPVLADWLRAFPQDDDEPFVWPRMHLEVAELQHPSVFWPLRDARAVLTLRPDGTDLTLMSGRWAGAPVRGEAFLGARPDPAFNVSLIVSPPSDLPQGPEDPQVAVPEAVPWLRGRFRVETLDRGPLAFESLQGDVAVTGSRVAISDVRAGLLGGGHLEGEAGLDLSGRDRVPAEISAQLVDGDVARLSGLFGLPEQTATGTVDLVASLHGPLVPGELPWIRATGRLSLEARDGEIRRRLPIVVAMAQATEGFNPFAARESVTYETIQTEFSLHDGVLESDEFRLEGPMRVFASGSLDLRADPPTIDAVVGVFLLRQADQLLGRVPIVNWLISDKGLIGAYFALEGPMSDPEVDTLEAKTLLEQTPDVIKAPFRVLRFLLLGREKKEQRDGASP